ncbi:MAG TPA: phosphotransferase [Actinoplanes sp.]|nr:phosphotransferase [Actinoplanes sp.]
MTSPVRTDDEPAVHLPDRLPSAVVAAPDRATLLATAEAEGWPLDLEGAQLDDTGWENVVLCTRDHWIIRFPRDAAVPFREELEILGRLRDRLPASIPVPVRIGRRVRAMVYRKLVGAAFDTKAYSQADPDRRDRLAASLADFLVAVHAVAPQDSTPRVDHAEIHRLVAEGVSAVPAQHRALISELADRYAKTWVTGAVPGPHVLLHNDFHTSNMVFREPVGELSGVWDFSCVATGAPTFDMRYFDRGPRDLLLRLADAYTSRTNRSIDVDAAILAHRVEDVHDALTTGRMSVLQAAVESWATVKDR